MNYFIQVHFTDFKEYERTLSRILPDKSDTTYSQVVLDLTPEEATMLKLSVPGILIKPMHLL